MAIATRSSVAAGRLATELASHVSLATLQVMTQVFEAKEDDQRGPLWIETCLVRDLGEERMKEFPPVDSYNEEGKPPQQNVDRFKRNAPLANGGTREVNAWISKDFADDTSSGQVIALYSRPNAVGGKEIIDVLDVITKKLAAETTLESEKVPLKKERGFWQGRRSTNQNKYRRAIQIWQKRQEFKVLDNIGVETLMDDVLDEHGKPTGEKQVTTSKWCMHVFEKTAQPGKTRDYVVWSITTFLGCDPAKAAANGGTLEALNNTITKAPDLEEQETAMKFDDLFKVVGRMNRLFEQDNFARVVAMEAGKKETGKIFAHELMTLKLRLDRLEDIILPGFDLVEKERREADAKEAADKAPKHVNAKVA